MIDFSGATVRIKPQSIERALLDRRWNQTSLASRMFEMFPTKYSNEETPKRLISRAKTQNINLESAVCIADALEQGLADLLQTTSHLSQDEQDYIRERDARLGYGLAVHVADSADNQQEAALSKTPAKRPVWYAWALAAGLVVAAAIGYWKIAGDPTPGSVETGPKQQFLISIQATDEIALPAGFRQNLLRATNSIIDAPGQPVPVDPGSFQQEVARLGMDGILSVQLTPVSRFVSVSAHVVSAKAETILWSELIPAAELNDRFAGFATRMAEALQAFFSGQSAPALALGTDDPVAFDSYTDARLLIEKGLGASVADLNAAVSALDTAIGRDERFALAYAARCEAIARKYWATDEGTATLLSGAIKNCQQARSLASEHPYVIAVGALAGIRDQGHEPFLASLQAATERHPNSLMLRLVLAEALYLSWTGATPDTNANGQIKSPITLALDELDVATRLAPAFWAPFNIKGTYAFQAGDMQMAAENLSRSAELNPNELAYANVATLSICLDQFELAEKNIDGLEYYFPDSHLGPEKRGTLHKMQGEFTEEVRQRERALRLLRSSQTPQIHQIFGALGAARARIGDRAGAVQAFEQGLSILAADSVATGLGADDFAARAFYRQMVATDGNPAALKLIESDLNTAQLNSVGVAGLMYLANLFEARGEIEQADAYIAKAAAVCPVYKKVKAVSPST